MSQELLQYIKAARGQGMSNEQIVQSLTAAGWRVHDVLDIVAEPSRATTGEPIITVDRISKNYGGKVQALDNISLQVQQGGVTAILGPNGAGKTTLIRILTTLLKPTSGRATVAGYDVIYHAQELRSIIGLAGQYAAVDEILTGRENLEMVAKLYHMGSHEAKMRAAELLRDFHLEDAADRTLKTYSGGMRRRLDLAASLIIRPKVLFLDEPTTGLDPQSRFALWDVIRSLVAGGTTVLLTTQYLEEADQLAQYIFVVDHGRIIAQGTANDLKRQAGGDVLELHMAQHSDTARAAELIKSFGQEAPHTDLERGVITMTVSGGATVLVNAIRKLDEAHIKLVDVMLRRPSLDDVFIKLTGHEAK